MAHEPTPPKRPWDAWGGDITLSRSWPSPQAGVDVDIHQLMKVGREMQSDMGNTTKEDASAGTYPDALPARFQAFNLNSLVTSGNLWDSAAVFCARLSVIGECSRLGINGFGDSYRNVGGIAFASGVNYESAEHVFDQYRPELKREVRGWGANHEIYKARSRWNDGDDISQWSAEEIKKIVAGMDAREMGKQASLCESVAAWLSDLQDTVEGRARQLSKAWPGETSGFALEALHEVQGTCRSLAYDLGKTGDVLSWFSGVVDQYQRDFESRVKIGDFDVDDNLPSWLGWLPGGGANERAHDYLRELKNTMASAYHMLPAQIEIMAPNLPSAYPTAFSSYSEDKLNDRSPFWGMLKDDLQYQREYAKQNDGDFDRQYEDLQAGRSKDLPPVGSASIGI